MTIEEIKVFLQENKDKEEIKDFIKSFQTKLTLDNVMADPEIKKAIIADQDRAITKAVENYKNEHLPKRVEEEIKKRAEKQPWEIEIAKLQEQLAQRDKEAKIASVKSKMLEKIGSKNLPVSIADYILDEDEEKATAKFEELAKHFDEYALKIKQDALKNYSTAPAGNQNKLVPNVNSSNEILPDLPEGATAADYKAAIQAKGGLKALLNDKK